MEEAVHKLAYWGALGIETIAILVVLFGSVQAVFSACGVLFEGDDADGVKRRHVWLVYARWLVAGLTFQLAADIVGTSFATSWEEVARLALIAMVRTMLSWFLDKEFENTRKLQHPDSTAN